VRLYAEEGALRVEDSGVGLTESDVHDLLATIGRSSKRSEGIAGGIQEVRSDFLGQFGTFMVADEVRVVTCERQREIVRETLDPLQELLNLLRVKWPHIVALLDGLDRMTDMPALEETVEHDIRGLHSLGIGMVLVGPLRALYGMDRMLEQRFDNMHYQPWVDIQSGPDARTFLEEVLKKRIPSDAVDNHGLDELLTASGGVLRDLLALAQSACVEAYLDGSDVIRLPQAMKAEDAFGRKHMQGLRPSDINVLERVMDTGTFIHTSEDELALLMTRRVLEYRIDGHPKYAVHPTISLILSARRLAKGTR